MRNSKSGFTIVELMLGVAILGILSSIAVPVTKDLISRARGKVHASGLRSGLMAVRAVASLTGKYPVTVGVTATNWLSTQTNSVSYVDCSSIVVTDDNTLALKDLCTTLPSMPQFTNPNNSHCGDPAQAAYLYTGTSTNFKIIAQCVGGPSDSLMYSFSGHTDPRRDGGPDNNIIDGYQTAWAMGWYTAGAATW